MSELEDTRAVGRHILGATRHIQGFSQQHPAFFQAFAETLRDAAQLASQSPTNAGEALGLLLAQATGAALKSLTECICELDAPIAVKIALMQQVRSALAVHHV